MRDGWQPGIPAKQQRMSMPSIILFACSNAASIDSIDVTSRGTFVILAEGKFDASDWICSSDVSKVLGRSIIHSEERPCSRRACAEIRPSAPYDDLVGGFKSAHWSSFTPAEVLADISIL